MKILKIISIVIAIIVLIAICFMWYIGFFTNVTITEKDAGGYKVAGLEITGSYSKVGPTATDVDKKLRAMGIQCTKGFGIYYDNPQVTPEEKCRSFVGNILEEKDYGKIEELKTKGLKVDSVPLAKALVIEFPIKNKFSYMVGPIKAYPAFTKYMNKKGIKSKLSLEVYDTPNKKTIFVMQY
ncbi:MAG: hypothetical protein PHD97_11165 [Bacteroidales bacterium]|nr:hypothetical protein [Bacteroidales bacterium]